MNPKWFQKLFYRETVLAIKSSLDFLSYESFKNDLSLLLPQESKKSRIRISNNILHRFFPDKKIYSFLPQIWEVFQDEELLREMIRYELLSKEPVISDFVLLHIHPNPEEYKLSPEIFKEYICKIYEKRIDNLIWWLQGSLRDIGLIKKSDTFWEIEKFRIPESAFILLFHRIFAPYPTTIKEEIIFNNDFWKLLGIKDIKIVKNILYKAHLLNIINYNDTDIQTIYSLENLLPVIKDSF